MPPEQNLWKWFRNEVKPLIAAGDLHICRIENLVGSGYPDVEGCYIGRAFHLELKAAPRPKRPTTAIKVIFQPRQVPWLRKRWSVGGNCWVLLRIGSGRDAVHYLVPGRDAHKMIGATEEEIAALSFSPPGASGVDLLIDIT